MGTILAFPERNKGRKRRCRSMDAAGCLTLMIMDRDGGEIPSNVQRLDGPKGHALPERSLELLFILTVWGVLAPEQKESVEQTLRVMAYSSNADPNALKLYNLVTGRF